MRNAYRYFPVTPMMKNWGLYVTCAGHHTIQPGDIFPSPKHPDEYFFSWKQGRILHEWQLILLGAGEGQVEFKDRAFTATVGSLIVLPPGCWHRYRPNPRTGWTTNWIGFGGDLADRLIGGAGFSTGGTVQGIGSDATLQQIFASTVADLLNSAERMPFAAASRIPVLVAALIEKTDAKSDMHSSGELIRKAQAYLSDHLCEVVDFEALGQSLGLSYRAFRYFFRKEAGQSPLQYLIERRLVRAKHLLAFSDIPIREISDSLGFNSTWYFSHFFRKHTGHAPADYRKRNNRHD